MTSVLCEFFHNKKDKTEKLRRNKHLNLNTELDINVSLYLHVQLNKQMNIKAKKKTQKNLIKKFPY